MHPESYMLRRLRDCDTLLDLGCGPNSWVACTRPWTHSIGVEGHPEAAEEARRRSTHREIICTDLVTLRFDRPPVDAVVMIDVIEHLEKGHAVDLLRRAEHWARKRLIVFTPNGFLPQGGHHGNPLQQHRSGWTVSELVSLGFKVRGLNGLRSLRGSFAALKHPSLAGQFLSDLTELICYPLPSLAFHLCGVKDLGGASRD